jgi:hypothetical protein
MRGSREAGTKHQGVHRKLIHRPPSCTGLQKGFWKDPMEARGQEQRWDPIRGPSISVVARSQGVKRTEDTWEACGPPLHPARFSSMIRAELTSGVCVGCGADGADWTGSGRGGFGLLGGSGSFSTWMDGDVQELWTQMRIDHAVSAPPSSTQTICKVHQPCTWDALRFGRSGWRIRPVHVPILSSSRVSLIYRHPPLLYIAPAPELKKLHVIFHPRVRESQCQGIPDHGSWIMRFTTLDAIRVHLECSAHLIPPSGLLTPTTRLVFPKPPTHFHEGPCQRSRKDLPSPGAMENTFQVQVQGTYLIYRMEGLSGTCRKEVSPVCLTLHVLRYGHVGKYSTVQYSTVL